MALAATVATSATRPLPECRVSPSATPAGAGFMRDGRTPAQRRFVDG